MQCSRTLPLRGVVRTLRQPRVARSSTAHTKVMQLVSPGTRPITFTPRPVSPKVYPLRDQEHQSGIVNSDETRGIDSG